MYRYTTATLTSDASHKILSTTHLCVHATVSNRAVLSRRTLSSLTPATLLRTRIGHGSAEGRRTARNQSSRVEVGRRCAGRNYCATKLRADVSRALGPSIRYYVAIIMSWTRTGAPLASNSIYSNLSSNRDDFFNQETIPANRLIVGVTLAFNFI